HGEKFWAISNGRWVRHKDVTTILTRNAFPDFAVDGQKWLDVSVVMGTLVAYEGKKPFFATLVSVGRDPNGGMNSEATSGDATAAPSASFGLGTFEVRAKHITLVGADPFASRESFQVYDIPWVFELSSGRLGYGAYWHERFGVEHGPGAIQLSPSDAARLFQWITPSIPEGWHAASTMHGEPKTMVVIRK
ncbi:MAG TPA: L,D-transpeptidase, partial [Polyangiaceae bacterium]|nr:L,D-transpeptidase [Polyangiaceae bacterium]